MKVYHYSNHQVVNFLSPKVELDDYFNILTVKCN